MIPVANEILDHTKFLIETQVMKQTNSEVYQEIWGEISDPVWDQNPIVTVLTALRNIDVYRS
jgi:hypothetical protein